MSRVEKAVGIRGETLRSWLEWVLDQHRWEELEKELELRFDIPAYDRSEFCRAIVVGRHEESDTIIETFVGSQPSKIPRLELK